MCNWLHALTISLRCPIRQGTDPWLLSSIGERSHYSVSKAAAATATEGHGEVSDRNLAHKASDGTRYVVLCTLPLGTHI